MILRKPLLEAGLLDRGSLFIEAVSPKAGSGTIAYFDLKVRIEALGIFGLRIGHAAPFAGACWI